MTILTKHIVLLILATLTCLQIRAQEEFLLDSIHLLKATLPNNTTLVTEAYQYDERNREIELRRIGSTTLTSYGENSYTILKIENFPYKIWEKEEYKTDDKGQDQSLIKYFNDLNDSFTITSFDTIFRNQLNQIIRKVNHNVYQGNQYLSSEENLLYNTKNLLQERTWTLRNTDGVISSQTSLVYEYNEKDFVRLFVRSRNSNGFMSIDSIRYEYNQQDSIEHENHRNYLDSDPNYELSREFEYFPSHKKISLFSHDNGVNIVSEDEYFYCDELMHPYDSIARKSYLSSGEISTYSYTQIYSDWNTERDSVRVTEKHRLFLANNTPKEGSVKRSFYHKKVPFVDPEIEDEEVTISLFPNPATSKNPISIYSPAKKLSKVFVYDQLGRQIAVHKIPELELASIPCPATSGAYFLQIEFLDSDHLATKKVIVVE